MTNLTRRQVLVGSAVGLGALALSSCAPQSGGAGGSTGGATSLNVWDTLSDTLEGESLAQAHTRDRYTAAHPGTTFVRRSIPAASYKQVVVQAAQARQLPDIIYCDNPDTSSFAELGILADLTGRINEWGQWSTFIPGAANSCIYDGKTWGVPDSTSALALIVNDDLLAAGGVTPPKTWDELRAAAKKLTKDKVQGFAIAGGKSESASFQFEPFLWSQGGDLDSLDGPASQDALQLWADLLADGSITGGCANYDQGDTLSQFLAGQLAMMYNGPWFYANLKGQSDVKWSVHSLPAGSQGVVSVTGGGNYIIIDNDHVDAAWDFVVYKSSRDEMLTQCREAGVLPARLDAIDEEPWSTDPALKGWADMVKVAKPRNYGPKYPQMSEVLQNMTQAVLTNTSSVKQAASDAARAMEPLLA